ncbi:MAG TPA: 30S ribosomal protein S24e [Candidatus Diapherotrites archaeon]|uniref:Small ribosomal subunit protein eS24 n=1 Tax=Candidatus Iainarchaeum sp. TaxID=3101447 RepID=A0A7J4JGH8_9ARCH|nr:30S ribosomal protein S24e [Candidatus Diapherotrites archaeon]HIH16230.1 30S ribosomal protein S24e [Candidatus Diapherotrites archaeon]
MEVEIVSREKNPLLQREEVVFRVEGVETTPSKKELRARLAALLNAKEDAVVVRAVRQRFGSKEVGGEAIAYQDAEQMKRTELKYIVNRNLGIKEAKEKKEEAPKAEAKAKK